MTVPVPSLSPDDLTTALKTMLGGGAAWDEARARLIVELALQRAEDILTPVPARARPLLLDVVVRGYSIQPGVQSTSVGPFSTTYQSAARAGVYLTDDERAQLRAMTGDDATAEHGAFTIHPGRSGSRRAWDVP